MNRLTSGTVLTIALLGMAGCSSDPTGDLRNGPEKLIASPSQLFLDNGRSATVEVGAVDEQGNPIEAAYVATNVGSNLSVKRDSTFLPVFVNDSQLEPPAEAPRFRFIVTANAFGASSFTVEGAGKSIVIPVQVVPNTDFAATFSTTTPALGETIVLTAAPGTHFTDSSLVIIGDTLNPPRTLAVAPDGSTISFLLPPNVNSPVSVTNVVADAAPTLVFTPTTIDIIQSPVYDSVSVGFSTSTPTLGQTVTATITDNPLIKFMPEIASSGPSGLGINFPGQLAGPLRGADSVHLRSGAGPQNVVVAADSSSLTFQAPPNANGPATVASFVFPGTYLVTLPTKAGITAPSVGDSLAATFSPGTTLNPLDELTITAPAGFKFDAAANDTVTFTGQVGIINTVAADGSNIKLIPLPGSTGPAQITATIPTAAPQFSLTMPTKTAITVGPLTPLAGTDDPATAPEVTVPGTLTDAGTWAATNCGTTSGGDTCQLYKLTLAAPTSLHFTLSGPGPADLGLYFLNSDLTDYSTFADGNTYCDSNFNNAPPEDCTLNFPAGTWIMVVTSFGDLYVPPDPNPPFIKLVIQ
jgi:hypothetical protein